jgi:hypothetical protein
MEINQGFIVDPLIVIQIQLSAAGKGYAPNYWNRAGRTRMRMRKQQDGSQSGKYEQDDE